MTSVVPAVVPEGAAADGVDDDDEDEEDNVDDSYALPVLLEGGHNAGLARLAAVAERRGGVVPGVAVRVRRVRGCLGPVRAAHVREAAAGWGLAASRLHEQEELMMSLLKTEFMSSDTKLLLTTHDDMTGSVT